MKEKNIQRITLISSVLAGFVGPFMVSAVNIALPSIGESFKADAVLISWVATSYLLSYAIFLVPFGKLSDMYGRKRIFATGVAIFSTGTTLAAFSPGINILLFFRFIQGLGSAMLTTTAISMLLSVYPPSKRGRVLGINVAAVYTGLSAGPFIGGFLTHNLGWQSIFLFAGPIGFIDVFFVLFYLKGEWADAEKHRFDLTGSFIYAGFLLLLMKGISLLPDKTSSIPLALSIVALILFIKRELSIKSPVFEVALFKNNRIYAFSNYAALINYASTFAVTFLLSLYLQYVKQLDAQKAGFILAIQPLIQALFSPLSGRLSDSIEPRLLASTGMGMCATGLAILSTFTQTTPMYLLVIVLIILGLGFALFSSPNMNSIMGSVSREYYGVASSGAGTMRLLGQMFSMACATVVFTLFMGHKKMNPSLIPDFILSMKILFFTFTLLSLLGIMLSMARGNLRKTI